MAVNLTLSVVMNVISCCDEKSWQTLALETETHWNDWLMEGGLLRNVFPGICNNRGIGPARSSCCHRSTVSGQWCWVKGVKMRTWTLQSRGDALWDWITGVWRRLFFIFFLFVFSSFFSLDYNSFFPSSKRCDCGLCVQKTFDEISSHNECDSL